MFFINISKLAQFIYVGHIPKEAGVVLICDVCVTDFDREMHSDTKDE